MDRKTLSLSDPVVSDNLCFRGNVCDKNFHEFIRHIYNDENVDLTKAVEDWTLITKGDSQLSKRERKDCTVFCLAVAFSISYDVAHKYMRNRGRQFQKAYEHWDDIILHHLERDSKISEMDETYYTYTNRFQKKSHVRVKTFMKQNPDGIYIITTKYHVLCIRYGVLIDRFDSSFYIVQKVHKVQ